MSKKVKRIMILIFLLVCFIFTWHFEIYIFSHAFAIWVGFTLGAIGASEIESLENFAMSKGIDVRSENNARNKEKKLDEKTKKDE